VSAHRDSRLKMKRLRRRRREATGVQDLPASLL